ncbi:MAG: ABC transporter substrate-binding protein [Bacillota bacterium]
MKFKKVLLYLLILTIFISLVGCVESNEKQTGDDKNSIYPIKIVDGMDREINIESEPKRVISVAPSVTETIYKLNKQDILVGKTEYCDYPKEAQSIDTIGSLQQPNIEKIISLKPDIVFASTHFKEESLKQLEQLDIKVVMIFSQKSFEGVYSNIDLMGKILGAKKKAENVIDEMKKEVKYVKDTVKDLEKKTAYYVVGFGNGNDFTATGETFISEMIEMAGGINIAKDATGWQYSLEKLIEKNPEVIISRKKFIDELKVANGYKSLDAIKNDRVVPVNNNLVERMGPRLSKGLLELAKAIHPKAFE